MKVYNYFRDNKGTCYLKSEGKNDLIEIKDIKKAIECIKFLSNPSDIKIIANSGCIEVTPLNNAPKIDPPIFKDIKILSINKNTLNVEIIKDFGEGLKKYNYKTKKINDSFIYEGLIYYTNVIEKVTINYE